MSYSTSRGGSTPRRLTYRPYKCFSIRSWRAAHSSKARYRSSSVNESGPGTSPPAWCWAHRTPVPAVKGLVGKPPTPGRRRTPAVARMWAQRCTPYPARGTQYASGLRPSSHPSDLNPPAFLGVSGTGRNSAPLFPRCSKASLLRSKLGKLRNSATRLPLSRTCGLMAPRHESLPGLAAADLG